ncbi:integrase catalytic domain-containing protein [Trichonephila clavipes]|nr:integrase catalytic domain-containing protein [Trichonephila clavipes]
MHHLAKDRIGMASEKMKTRYDARATGHDFHEGDKVWLWNLKRCKGFSPRLQTNWEVTYYSAGICSGIWVRRTLNPVSGKKSIFCMAIRFGFMLWSESLQLDERQASRRGFEAWILTSRRILLLKSKRKIESSYWLLESEDNGSEKMAAHVCGGGISVNVRPVAINNCQIREDEEQELLGSQCVELDSLLKNHHSIFEVGGEATQFIEHSIKTENNPPISVPPYQMNPARKELLNSAKCDTTGKNAAYLQFGREIRTIDYVPNDFRAFIDNENFVPEITPYLKRLARISSEVRERIEEKQDQRKTFYDKRHRPGSLYHPGDKVWVTLHHLSNAAHKKTAKFNPKEMGLVLL